MNIPPKYEDIVAQLDAALGREAALRDELNKSQALSVTSIMLDIVPGDGNGHEVYAKTVADVEVVLTKLWIENEDLQALCIEKDARMNAMNNGWAAAIEQRDALQQRLTVAEQLLQRSQSFVAFVHKCCRKNKEYAPMHWQEMVELDRDLSALKPAAEGEGS